MSLSVGLLVVGYKHRRYIDAYVGRLRPQVRAFDQVLFIDNGGADGSADAFRGAHVGDVLYRDDSVLHTALNEGIALLQTDYVLLCSLDDLLKPDAGVTVRYTLSRAPRDVGVVWCDADTIDESGQITRKAQANRFRVWPAPVYGLLVLAGLRSPGFNGSLVKRSVALATRYREEDWTEDYGFTIRASLRHTVAESGTPWAEYRQHASNWSIGAGRMFEVSSSATRYRIVDEFWPANGPRRSAGRALAAYGASRWAYGRRDLPTTVRFALESLREAPALPIALHTLIRSAQATLRAP